MIYTVKYLMEAMKDKMTRYEEIKEQIKRLGNEIYQLRLEHREVANLAEQYRVKRLALEDQLYNKRYYVRELQKEADKLLSNDF